MELTHQQGIARIRSAAIAATAAIALAAAPATAATQGTELWRARYEAPPSGFTSLDLIAVAPDGSTVFVAGERVTPSEDGWSKTAAATLAYDAATGAELWQRRYAGPFDSASPLDMAVSPDGSSVFVTGRTAGGDPVPDPAAVQNYVTIAYDAQTGTMLWLRTFDGFDENDIAFSVAATDDAVFVTGQSYKSPFIDSDYLTLAYDAATGDTIWSRRFDSPDTGAGSDDYGAALDVTGDGSTVFVTGTTFSSQFGFGDIKTMAYDASTGHLLWSRRFDDANHGGDLADDLVVAGRRVFITGSAGGRAVTLAYAFDGHRLWIRPQRAPISDVAPTPDGGAVFVTGGNSGAGTRRDVVTRAYDGPTGTLLWKARYNGPTDGNDAGMGVATGPDGATVYVTASIMDDTGFEDHADVATIAYDASTGARRWLTMLEQRHGANAMALSVAANPLGDAIYITARAAGTDFAADTLTVAYAS